MKLPIEKTLVINTCHITRIDNDTLKDMTEQDFDCCRVVNFECGFILFLTDDLKPGYVEDACAESLLSGGMSGAINLAVENKCTYLVLDRDGAEVSELPTYDW